MSQDAAAGRLGQVIGRWSCTACLIFGLDLADQQRTCLTYAYPACQAGYSRNLLFACGGHMHRVAGAMLDRARSRLDIPPLRTLFGARRRPGKYGTHPSPRAGVVPGTPAWDLTVFKACFGLLPLKGRQLISSSSMLSCPDLARWHDVDGDPADEKVRFGIGGAGYEIDLSAKNATASRRRLAPFIDHTRKGWTRTALSAQASRIKPAAQRRYPGVGERSRHRGQRPRAHPRERRAE